MADGAVVEVVEANHEPGTPLIPTRVRVNGIDVGALAKAPKERHAMWSKGQWTLVAEVRPRAAKFGATPEGRDRLKLKVDDPTSKPAAPTVTGGNVSDINSRRQRLTS
ncbi:hypothetical protein AB0C96_13665 [Streptomyces sp. NPDC048506]|uniref:phage terminase small subunit n=1 Tax=Streptomyces sp. NPDC048506 TaxID=3155028 RepID=UPI003418D68E